MLDIKKFELNEDELDVVSGGSDSIQLINTTNVQLMKAIMELNSNSSDDLGVKVIPGNKEVVDESFERKNDSSNIVFNDCIGSWNEDRGNGRGNIFEYI